VDISLITCNNCGTLQWYVERHSPYNHQLVDVYRFLSGQMSVASKLTQKQTDSLPGFLLDEGAVVPHSCSQCQGIIFPGEPEEIYFDAWETGPDPDHKYRRDGTYNRLGISLRDLKTMAGNHCTFASQLLKHLGNMLCNDLDPELIQIYTRYVWSDGKFNIYALASLEDIYNSDKGINAHLDRHLYRCYASRGVYRLVVCDRGPLQIPESQGGGKIPSIRHVAVDPLSRRTTAEIRSWLSACDLTSKDTHRVCSMSEQPFIPTRLIEVSQSTNGYQLRLVRGTTLDKARYSALSYCWGGKQEKQLTDENLQTYEQGIPWTDLPNTLKDAAAATYRIGLRYLWIDSMCIIQNDQVDKPNEIRQMAQIYTHAHFTIVDMRGHSAGDGFLHARTLPSGTSASTYRSTSGLCHQVVFQFQDVLESEDDKVLETRGGALQEYVLSRRLIVFGTWSTQWMCRTKRFLGMDGWRLEYDDVRENPFRKTRLWASFDKDWYKTIGEVDLLDVILYCSMNPELRDYQPKNFPVWEVWESLVGMYSTRNFSVPQDRNVALSGLAERFAPFFPSQRYVAGMWEHSLLRGLLWSVDMATLDRPRDGRAPSWSWQSVDESVECRDGNGQVVCTTLSLDYTLAESEALFGAVTSANLKLQGPSFSIEWRYIRSEGEPSRNDKSETRTLESKHTGDPETCVPFLDLRLDARENDTRWTEVLLFAIKCDRDDLVDCGLALIQDKDATRDSTFRRIGYFCFFYDQDEDEDEDEYEDEYEDEDKDTVTPIPISQWQERVVQII
jgi:hypothetical protein